MDINIIKVNVTGKTKEEIIEEVSSQIADELCIGDKEAKEERKTSLKIETEEVEDKSGLNVHIAMEGNKEDLFNLLVFTSAKAFIELEVDANMAMNYGAAIAFESERLAKRKEKK